MNVRHCLLLALCAIFILNPNFGGTQSIKQLRKQVKALNNKVKVNQEEIQTCKAELDATKQDLDEIKENVSENKAKTLENEQELDEIKVDVSENIEKTLENEQGLADVERSVSANQIDIDKIREDMCTCNDDPVNSIIIIGGHNNDGSNLSTNIINMKSGRNDTFPPPPEDGYRCFGGLLGKTPIFISVESGNCYKLGDPTPFYQLIYGRLKASYVVFDDKLWFFGGLHPISTPPYGYLHLNSTEFVSLNSEMSGMGPDMPTKFYAGCVTLMDTGSRIIITGGFQDSNFISDKSWIFDIRSENWLPGPTMIHGRTRHSCSSLDSIVIVTGGYKNGFLDKVEILLPNYSSWKISMQIKCIFQIKNNLQTFLLRQTFTPKTCKTCNFAKHPKDWFLYVRWNMEG